jgi:hypothetical protein
MNTSGLFKRELSTQKKIKPGRAPRPTVKKNKSVAKKGAPRGVKDLEEKKLEQIKEEKAP